MSEGMVFRFRVDLGRMEFTECLSAENIEQAWEIINDRFPEAEDIWLLDERVN